MKIVNLVTLVFLIAASFVSKSQNIEEEVYLHLNSSNVISGESILFSAYVNSKTTGKPSPLSKILYIELVNEEGKIALQSKMSLENGRGYGDVFVSSVLSTGVYQLLAYTRWMKNFGAYFEIPIVIINPFEKTTPSPIASADWSMNFYTPQSGILLNQENNISFRVTNDLGKGAKFKGKIVDETGSNILDFSPLDQGIGNFNFRPEKKAKFQAVVEDEQGQFHFFDLPQIQTNGSNLLIAETKVSYEINIVSSEESFEGSLIIVDKKQEILNQSIVRGSTHLIPKRNLTSNLYQIILLSDDSKILDTRTIYQPNPQEKDNDERSAPSYKKRSLVNLTRELPSGSYSISSRKIRNNIPDYRPTTESYSNLYFAFPGYYNLPVQKLNDLNYDTSTINILLNSTTAALFKNELNEVQYLPDYRGELISGHIIDQKNDPIIKKQVMYSSLGTNLLSVSTTNNHGDFVINVSSINEDNTAYISLLDTGAYTVSIESNFLDQRPEFLPPTFKIDSALLSEIVESSVRTQIENAYFDIKKDSTFNAANPAELFGEFEYFYYLDDYNRFPTIRETFIEYMPAIAVKQKHGKPVIETRSGGYNPSFNEPTLILLDGIPVDVESLYKFSPYKVKSVGVIGKRYYLGPMVYDGVISLHTFERNLHDFVMDENKLEFTMQGVQKKKSYHHPNYSNKQLDRIPDKREQLLWIPNVKNDTGTLDIEFYTSDVSGKYELIIEGFTSEGKPVSTKEYFEVVVDN